MRRGSRGRGGDAGGGDSGGDLGALPGAHGGSEGGGGASGGEGGSEGGGGLVGGGPGDPGLITLHALNALQQADVIIYDALVDSALLRWARPDAEVEYAGKRGGKPSPNQRDISLRLIELARQAKVEDRREAMFTADPM